MAKKIVWLFLSFLLVVALVLPSCQSAAVEEEEVTETVTGEVTETVAPTVEEEEEEEAPAAVVKPTGPQHGGTLVVQTRTIDALTWDPADCTWATGSYGLHYENLLQGDRYRGRRGTNEYSFQAWEYIPDEFLTGGLAESWEITNVPLQIVFHMREGVYWNPRNTAVMSPREVTAADAAFALSRYDTSPKSSPARLEWVDTIEAVDKYTLVLSLNEFHANWGYLVAWGWSTMIYPPEYVDAGPSDWKNSVGTGPWMVDDYVSGSSLTYKRNPNYWQQEIIDGVAYDIPFCDTLLTPIVPDESTRIAALRTGKVDLDESVTWRYKDSLIQANPDLKYYSLLGTGVLMIGMRCDQEPFSDIRVRRAMNLAVDNQAILDTQYGGEGAVQNFPLYAGYPTSLYTPVEDLPEECAELYGYHPDKAKALLAEAGYPSGFKTRVIVRNYPTDVDVVSMCVSYWADIGVEVEIEAVEYATLYGRMADLSHEGMLCIGKGTACTPLSMIRTVGLTGQWWNPAIFSSEYYDGMYDKIKGTMDAEEQARLIKEATTWFICQAPYIPGPAGNAYRFYWPWVNNYWGESTFTYIDQNVNWACIWLDLDLKKSMGY